MDARHAQYELWQVAASVLAVPLVALALLMPSWPLMVLAGVVGVVWTVLAAAVAGRPGTRRAVHLTRWAAAAVAVMSVDGAGFLDGRAALLTFVATACGVVLWIRQLGPDASGAPGGSVAPDPTSDPTWPRRRD